LLSLCFLPSPAGQDSDSYTESISIGLLYIDHQARIQLVARDLDIEALDLSVHLSPALAPTPLSTSSFTEDFEEGLPSLVPIPTNPADAEANFRGGVLVLGGRKIMMFDMASEEHRKKWIKKNQQTERQKKEESQKEKLKAKEREREGRKRKARSTVEWPWSAVTAYYTQFCSVRSSQTDKASDGVRLNAHAVDF
jgi:DNA damage-binding protein 1